MLDELGPCDESTLSGRREASSSASARKEDSIACAEACVRAVLACWIVGGRGVRPGCAIVAPGEVGEKGFAVVRVRVRVRVR